MALLVLPRSGGASLILYINLSFQSSGVRVEVCVCGVVGGGGGGDTPFFHLQISKRREEVFVALADSCRGLYPPCI